MNNPHGPYPGRQLFLGMTTEKKPCFAYLITGRSPASRERVAIPMDNGVRIGPLGIVQYDPLRHYSAVKYDPVSGLLAVSNGIQTEAIFETYKLLFNTGKQPDQLFMEKLLNGAGAEPDPPLNTARIAGVVASTKEGIPVYIIGIKTFGKPAKTWQFEPKPAEITGISTYNGNLEKPETPELDLPPSRLEFKGHTSSYLATYLFDISAASNKGSDIRVCTLGGVRTDKHWNISIKNVLTA
jgi:IMP cyclohydrolase